MLDKESGCSLCTSYTHKRSKCYQKKGTGFTSTYKELVGNRVCGQKHHPLLHPSKSSYCLVTALLMLYSPEPTCKLPLSSHAEPGGSSMIRKSSASLLAVLRVPVRAVGGSQCDVALMLEDNDATENFTRHKMAVGAD